MSEERVLTISEALREGIVEEMERDERVFCIGEDIGIPGGWGGAFTVTLGLEQKFPERTINTPISEIAIFGAALGAAVMGMRPIADVQYGDFLFFHQHFYSKFLSLIGSLFSTGEQYITCNYIPLQPW